MKIDWSIWPHQ